MSYERGPWDDYASAAVPNTATDADAHSATSPPASVPAPHPLMLQQHGMPPQPEEQGPWSDYGAPADRSTTVGDAKIGDWQDLLPNRPVSKLSPEDEATLVQLYKAGTAPQITQFQSSRGYHADAGQNQMFVAARDKARSQGGKVNYGITYALPKIHNEDGSFGAGVRGVARGVTSRFLDEAGAVVDTLGGTQGRPSIWNSDKSVGDLYNNNVDQNRAILGADDEDHPYVSLAGELAGGLVLPVVGEAAGLTRGIQAVAQDSYRAARLEGFSADEARTIAQRTVARRMSTEGAAYGGAYGVGGADGDPGERLTGGVTGAITGGIAGRLLGAVGEHVAPGRYAARVEARSMPTPELSEAAQIAQAASNQGVDILPQDVGGAGLKRATQGAAQSTYGAGVIARAANRVYDSFDRRVSDLAGDAPTPRDVGEMVGERSADAARKGIVAAERDSGTIEGQLSNDAPDATGAGQLIQRGVSRFMDDTAERASALYNEVPIAAEQPAQLGATRRLLADLTTRWQSNPELGAAFQNSKLGRYLKALTPAEREVREPGFAGVGGGKVSTVSEGGQLSWQDLSEFRTRVGDMLADPNLTEKIAPRQLRALYGALTTDMEATAREVSPEAFAKWKRANNFYDGRMKRINDTFAMVLGNKGDATPNEAFTALQAMLKPGASGNAAAFARILRSMSPDDANAVRATIVNSARGGRQFDPGAFAKAWGQISERGKSALLPQAGMRDIMDDAAHRAATDNHNPFAGLSGEQVFAKLDAMAGSKGDAARFQATLAKLSPEEANSVRSTFIHLAGRALPGSQNAEGDAFSIARWLTRWNTMTDDAKRALFGGGELRAAMNDLAKVAENVKSSEKLAGHSNTGAINDFSNATVGLYGAVSGLLAGVGSGHFGLGAVAFAAGAGPAAYQRITAEMLTSPRLLRWLTRVPKQADYNGQAAYLSKLSTIAAREPAIASNVLQLRDYLRTAMMKSPEKAAAQDVGDRRKEPVDQGSGNDGL